MISENTKSYIRNTSELPAGYTVIDRGSVVPVIQHIEDDVLILTVLCDNSSDGRIASIEGRNKLIAEGRDIVKIVRCDPSVIETLMNTNAIIISEIDIEQSRYQTALNDLIERATNNPSLTDIHIECSISGKTMIRARVGGQLFPFHEWSGLFGDKVISVLFRVEAKKTLSDRSPLDANLERTFDGKKYMLRLNYKPTYDGHDTVIRIQRLGKANVIPFERAGYTNSQIIQIRTAITIPQRLVLVIGTTGSGKSTTLQAMLTEQIEQDPYNKVMTLEDPVEYIIDGARQSQLAPGMSFNDFLKACLRSDPDTIMIGEIRDHETASLVEKATLTGHKMYGTLHANSVFATIPRLEKIGIDRSIMSSKDFFNTIICQKLVPHTCPHCSVSMYADDTKAVDAIGIKHQRSAGSWLAMQRRWNKVLSTLENIDMDGIRLSNPDGCDKCRRGLTSKRSVAAEILIPDMSILRYIRNGEDFEAWQHWRENGGVTKLEHAVHKTISGDLCPSICERLIDPVTTDEVHKDGVLECSEMEVMGGYIKT